MRVDVVKVGNSRGIRLPAAVLKQCGIGTTVELEVQNNRIILKPVHTPRQGWALAFKRMAQVGDDQLLIPDELDHELLEEWNAD